MPPIASAVAQYNKLHIVTCFSKSGFSERLKLSRARATRAVSYTHLDVYKRQPLTLSKVGKVNISPNLNLKGIQIVFKEFDM